MQQSCGSGGTRRLDGWEVKDSWRQLVTLQACRLAGVEAEGAGPRQGKEPKEVVGKAVGVARRGKAGQGNVPRARPVELRTGLPGEQIVRH